jgi:hypothetical protein
LLIATRVGLIEAGGVAIAMTLAMVFIRLKGHREVWVLRPFVAIVMSVILWGVGVDYSVFRTDCNRCRLHWHEAQVRVFAMSIFTRRSYDHQEFFSLVAADLGHSCEHQLHRQQTLRFWGIVFYVHPSISGTCCLSGDEWYFDPQREQMGKLGQENPSLAQEFHDCVILNQDYKYCRDFVVKFRTEHDPSFPILLNGEQTKKN